MYLFFVTHNPFNSSVWMKHLSLAETLIERLGDMKKTNPVKLQVTFGFKWDLMRPKELKTTCD